ncbi:uncharacterized protein LOC143372069 [Andrena cerasifolii]|uniref:uncharacterized protein LOC143372069 n=1 Tax=Andrena cerasifolii TaxID=2819439 RepID=UPI0040377940
MEIKESNDVVMEIKDTMTNAPAFKNFPLSRIVLQQTSKNTNIVNTINQLLSRYHPDDGIGAYKHVLETLLLLSENFDSNTQQQLISIVPLPTGASNEAIRDIICKATGLIRPANNATMCQNVAVPEGELSAEASSDKSKLRLCQNVLVDTASQNLELDENFVPSVPEVFRGFPPNEISMIHSHVRNVNYVYDTLDYITPCVEPCIDVRQSFPSDADQHEELLKLKSNLKYKWIHMPHLLYKNNAYQASANCQRGALKSVDDKYLQLPIDKLSNQWNMTNISHTLHQDNACFKKKLCKAEAAPNKQDTTETSDLDVTNRSGNFSNSEINYCELLRNEDQAFKKLNANENKMLNMERQKRLNQELKAEQQAIQQDIYKMDVVCLNEGIDSIRNSQVPKESNFTLDNFVVHAKLKTSMQNFLKRAEQEIFIEFPRLPETQSLHAGSCTSKYWKFVTQKHLENKKQLDIPVNNTSSSKGKSASESIKNLIEKKASRSLNVCPKSSQLQVLQKSLNIALGKAQTVECEKKDNIENLLYKSAVKQIEHNNVNILQQTASVTELATFKKHYYDTLLNIQKAKVAVANSLAISSVESSTKYDPYYSSCSYQQQQLLQQHGQLTVNPQFAVHTMAQSGLSNVHNTPYTWVRYNNWRHPTVRRLRFPQQSPFQHSRNKESSVLHYVRTVDVQCFARDKNKQTKRRVQRKKLEDIVGKLKEIENDNINN